MKKGREKEAQPGRWRAAEEKLAKLLSDESVTGTEGLTEEELATVSGRVFDRAGNETRQGIIRLAQKLRSPLMAERLIAKAGERAELGILTALAGLSALAESAPAWIGEAPDVEKAVLKLSEDLQSGATVDAEAESARLAAMAEPLRWSALHALVRTAGEAIVPVARALALRDPSLAAPVAEAVSEISSQTVADFLVDLLSQTEDKKLGKSLRRSLQRLRQHGIKVELPQQGAPVYKPPAPVTAEAYVTGIDGQGARLVFLAQPRAPHGLSLFEALISEEKGLLEFNAYETQRRGLEKFMRSLRERPSLLLAATTTAHARYLIGAAMERNISSGARLPQGASELRPYWDEGDEPPAPLGEEALAAVGSDDDGSALAASDKLLENEAFKGWYMDPDLVGPYVERAREAAGSRIVLNALQKRERMAGLIREATDALFADPAEAGLRGRYAQRLREMAWLLHAQGEGEAATRAKAVYDRLADPKATPSMTPFLYALVEKTVSILTRDEEEKEKKTKEEEGPSVIVKP